MDSGPASRKDSRGFVFATTGNDYTVLARRAASTLRLAMPDANIDLFTDQPVTDTIFDQVHQLDRVSHRPKMEAMRNSRFDKTIYLDADIFVLSDVSDVFFNLGRCDMAGTLAALRTKTMSPPDTGVPRSYPVINSGVLALQKSPKVSEFLAHWESEVLDTGAKLDQPALRRLMFHSSLNFLALPKEYNLIQLALLNTWSANMGAPRILHCRSLHKRPPRDPEIPFSLDEVLQPSLAQHVRDLISRDWSLGGKPLPLATPLANLRAELKREQGKINRQNRIIDRQNRIIDRQNRIVDKQDHILRPLEYFGLVRAYTWLSERRRRH